MKAVRHRRGSVRALRPSGLPALQTHVRAILEQIGEDPTREGLAKTPARVARAYEFLTSGYAQDPKAVINGALFVEEYSEMILCRDIDFFSLCEHHLLPFFGKCHVAYLPKGRIIGLSKIPRLVDAFARRLQVQERLTQQIAESLQTALEPRGVGVVIAAQHWCMTTRGVRQVMAATVTSRMTGECREPELRRDLLALARR